jgi:predicted RNA-binding protein with RPS1 domain
MAEAQRELNELLELTQDVPIHIFKLDDFNNIELSYKQMNALMFMIEE